MDWFLVNYMFKNKLRSEENINAFMLYVSTVSTYIERYLESESVRHNMIRKLTTEKVDDRNNKARGKYLQALVF